MSSYIDKSLMPGERVVFRTRLSWIIFVRPIVLVLAGIALFATHVDTHGGPDDFSNALHVVGSIVLILSLVIGIVRYIRYRTSEFGVTDKRVIIKQGIIRRNTLEMQNSKVESIEVSQGILGRILGYGDITVIGAGGTNEPFPQIDAPLEFRRAVQAQSS